MDLALELITLDMEIVALEKQIAMLPRRSAYRAAAIERLKAARNLRMKIELNWKGMAA